MSDTHNAESVRPGWQVVRVAREQFDEAERQGKNVGVMLSELGFDVSVDDENKTKLTAVLVDDCVVFEGPLTALIDGPGCGSAGAMDPTDSHPENYNG